MRNYIFWATTILVLAAVPFLATQKENTLVNGRAMLLKLAPRDPRSLMQGDYMVLRYELDRNVPASSLKDSGRIVVSLDKDNVATFVRLHDDTPLRDGEHLLLYRNRGGLRLGAESFMFQEGDANLYAKAKFGELKVDPSGASVLVGLRDENRTPLGRGTWESK